MNTQELKSIFLKSVNEYTEELFNIGKAPEYTNKIFKTVLPKLAKELELEPKKEFVPGNVDLALLETTSDGFKRPLWVIEHENNGAKAYEEVTKLSLLSSPNKFLITYIWDNREGRDGILKEWAKIIYNLDMNNEIGNFKKFYIAIGSMNPYSSEQLPNKFVQNIEDAWEFYEYSDSKFHRV
ncbi:hypothetical protein NX722_03045 [Endozoicomonas gorgoniicola]|uniref:Uncharacterized protein n=1 Tax=Endozoicomonas gorgoniicola TaxID=1234144 RepID=A0ABT3MQK3_9GAMM|nr:hypothetical protein [Endozoicomonas gorgoniicola]MCW7551637.1 hypothetical protein [Endozoicomonas gorgoniicola]